MKRNEQNKVKSIYETYSVNTMHGKNDQLPMWLDTYISPRK